MSRNVGILTVVNCDNNGTDIQALAMQLMLSSIGVNAHIIDYVAPKWERKITSSLSSLRDCVYLPVKLYMRCTHKRFRKINYNFTTRVNGIDDIDKLGFDTIVVGSDQIWNLDLTKGDETFFLPGEDKKYRKVSYAASLGRTHIQDWEAKYQISKLLRSFEGISVREDSAVRAMYEIGVVARNDLDPVLMIDGGDWKMYAKQFTMKRKYVLLYLVESNAHALEYAKVYAQKSDYDVICITSSPKPTAGVISRRFVSIEKWLSYVANAELVITNSYHCLAISVDMQTPFCIVMLKNNLQSNARMMDLVEKLSLSERIFDPNKAELPAIDWKSCTQRLEQLRKTSKDYLEGVLKKCRR